MTKDQLADAMRGNRADSITRRPSGPTSSPSGDVASRMAGLANLAGASMIPVERIIPDADQPRREFDEGPLLDLAESLKSRGQLQPIRVRWSQAAGHYVVIVGERRWRAARMAGMESIACVIVQGNASPEELLEDQLVENAIRENLKPVEQATAYRTLMDARGWSLRDLASRLHVHFTSIQKSLALLDLDPRVQESIESGELAASTAQAIAANIEDPAEQVEVAGRIMAEGLNRAEASKVVRKVSRKAAPKGKPSKLPTERSVRVEQFKVSVTARRGFDAREWLEALEKAAELVRSKLDAEAA
jgi:ParB family chromosome partitioning protein